MKVKQRYWLMLGLLLALIGAFVTQAQDIEPLAAPPEDADIAISFPPPVFVIGGAVDIRGTVDTLDMANYFVEYRPLLLQDTNSGATPIVDTNRPWFPATLPANQAVRNSILGTWNTTTARDGLYELRLVVNVTSGAPQIFRVSPIRVLNNPTQQFVSLPTRIPLQPTPTQIGGGSGSARPTLAATPTSLNTGEPTVTALTDSNVRQGDDVSYPRIGSLLTGESARVIGVSAFNSGWYYIELNNGRRGFIAPNIVRFSGSESGLQRIQPPPPPTPPATATPITSANLQVTGLRLDPPQPTCGESFDIFINVQNTGTGRSNSSGTLTVTDRHVPSGSTSGSTIGGFPELDANASFVVVASLTINVFFDETHEVVISVDPSGQVVETNEGDNSRSITYTLQQGACG
ncbi:MAG: CARDB domain-containing protein [Anaerolineae bacterium]|nr:CARDB domain-containing protein [Anaerolineae bacterium]